MTPFPTRAKVTGKQAHIMIIIDTRVCEVMERDPAVVRKDETVTQVAESMAKFDLRVIVVKDGDKVVGILTDHDIVARCVAESKPLSTPVHSIMSSSIAPVHPDMHIMEALDIMHKREIHRLAVVEHIDKKQVLVGIITEGDIKRRIFTDISELLKKAAI